MTQIDTTLRRGGKGFNVHNLNKIQLFGYIFILPALVTLAALVVYPLIYGFYISFFKTNLSNIWDFKGVQNYIDLFKTPDFSQKILLTLRFTTIVVFAHFIIGTGLALLVNKKRKFITIFRAILVLPWIMPEVVIALLFKWIMNPLYGILNAFLLRLGLIETNLSWLGNTKYAFLAVVLVSVWKGYPLIMINVLAGLQSISADLFEASRIDGANRWQTLRYITLPSIKPVLVTVLVLDTVWWFKHFTIVWLLTNGGPGNDTSIISIDIYKTAFDFFNFGKAAAMSVIVFIICLLISILYRRIFDREDK